MSNFKLPPREKIHEALSAIADNRVVISDNSATVSSSDNSKTYIVEWNNNTYSSNDNASYWQGYAGYPIIAVLLLQDKLKYTKEYLQYFKGINWKQLNKQYKNDFTASVNYIYHELESKEIDIQIIDQEISDIYNQLSLLDIKIKRSSHFPPK